MAEFFRFLVESNIITAAFVIGALAFIIAVIGKVKTMIEPSPTMRFVLALFGLFLMAFSVSGYFFGSQVAPRSDEVSTQGSESGGQPTQQPTGISSDRATSIPTSTVDISRYCYDWEKCWAFDDNAKTMTWIGPGDGTGDIGQAGIAIDKIRSGYTAIFTIQTELKITICVGEIDGQEISRMCNLTTLPIAAGTHRVVSPGSNGGFRIHQ